MHVKFVYLSLQNDLQIVLSTFEAQPLSDDEGNAVNLEDEAANFSIKYLTSTKLMGLEVRMSAVPHNLEFYCLKFSGSLNLHAYMFLSHS